MPHALVELKRAAIRTITAIFLSSIGLCLLPSSSNCQDIHFSQFNNAPFHLNPALSGVFDGDLRFIANYRSQWNTVPVSYRTVAGAMDAKFRHKLMGNSGYFGYSLSLFNDEAGDAELGITKIGGSLAYVLQLTDNWSGSVGFQAMIGQRSLSPQQLTYEEQWNGDLFDPSLPNNEDFKRTSKGIFAIGSGFNLHYQPEGHRHRLDFGTSIQQINTPNTSFFDEPTVELPRVFLGYIISTIELGAKTDLRANIKTASQLAYQETILGAALRYHLSLETGKELSAQLGLSYRFGDAIIPTIEMQYRNWTAGFSYDQNFSAFKVATNQRGGPEFFLQYTLKKVAPPKEFKACPIF